MIKVPKIGDAFLLPRPYEYPDTKRKLVPFNKRRIKQAARYLERKDIRVRMDDIYSDDIMTCRGLCMEDNSVFIRSSINTVEAQLYIMMHELGHRLMYEAFTIIKKVGHGSHATHVFAVNSLDLQKMDREFYSFLVTKNEEMFPTEYSRTNYSEFFAEMFCNHVFDNLTDKQDAWISGWIEVARKRNFVYNEVMSAAA